MKRFIGWLLVIGGAFLIGIDLALTEGGPAEGFFIVGFASILAGCAVLGCFRGLIADDPNPEYSRLDRMDGLGALTEEELSTLRQEQYAAARDATNTADYDRLDAVLAEIAATTAELDGRLDALRPQAGWVWPKEGTH